MLLAPILNRGHTLHDSVVLDPAETIGRPTTADDTAVYRDVTVVAPANPDFAPLTVAPAMSPEQQRLRIAAATRLASSWSNFRLVEPAEEVVRRQRLTGLLARVGMFAAVALGSAAAWWMFG